MENRYEIHLVSHTHWDREWYRPFEETRVRLVKLIDKLLTVLDETPDYRYFVLDGQAVILEDYLEIRPEKKEVLRHYIKRGRIFVGPWYVLPDEFLESGEALIRNLMRGHKVAFGFGRVMKVGYAPDPFGHISQLPQILRGFGITSLIFSRGLGEEGERIGSEFIWRAPDGSKVLAIRQAAAGYWDARALGYDDPDESGNTRRPLNLEKALETINQSRTILAKYARTKYLLSNNGEDFYEPQPEIPSIIRHLNANLRDATVSHSNFENLVAKITSSHPKLDQLEGEMRAGKYQFQLSGVTSTRMYLKQANQRSQTLLEKISEPLATLAWLEGKEYPEDLLGQSWRHMLQCHPHDSICGCGVDKVHRDVMRRFSKSQRISNTVSEASFNFLAERADTTSPDPEFQPAIVFNTLNWTRSDVAKVKMRSSKKSASRFVVYDSNGRKISSQTCRPEGVDEEKEGEVEIAFPVTEIPPYSYRVYHIAPSEKREVSRSPLKIGKDTVENEYIQIRVNRNGTLRIRDKASKLTLDELHLFEDIEDAGDEYNYSPARISRRITGEDREARVTVQEEGSVYATLKIEMNLSLPEELVRDRRGRSEYLVECPLQSYVTLYAGGRRVDLRTVFENKVRDHRLRVLFPTDIKTDHSYAESQFDVVKREIDLSPAVNWKDPPSPTHPQQSFVTISDEKKGLTLINQGLPEYEAYRTNDGTGLALTLLRCVGHLSRNDLLTRRGDAGPRLHPHIHTPEAQCLGRHEFRYALILHKGGWEENKIWQQAYNYNTPLLTQPVPQHPAPLPKEFTFLKIEPETLIVSALKKADGGERLILRVYSLERKPVKARVKLYRKIRKAYRLNLNEKIQLRKGEIMVSGDKVLFTVKPRRIVTLGIEF